MKSSGLFSLAAAKIGKKFKCWGTISGRDLWVGECRGEGHKEQNHKGTKDTKRETLLPPRLL